MRWCAGLLAVCLGFLGMFVFYAFSGIGTTNSSGMQAIMDCAPKGANGITAVAVAGPAAPAAAAPVSVQAQSSGTWTSEQMSNAALIIGVGVAMHVPAPGEEIAVITALDESTLVNLDHGDRDSVGLFQQRTSQGWGTVAQIMDPRYSSRKFYTALLGTPGWQTLTMWSAAQAVQASGTPDGSNYRAQVDNAEDILRALGKVPAVATAAAPAVQVAAAHPAVASTSPCAVAAPAVVPAVYHAKVVTSGTGHIVMAGGIQVDQTIAPHVAALLTAAHADGIDLGGSGYRSNARQRELRLINGCVSVMSGPCLVPTATPGHSMHERGLAVDFTQGGSTLTHADSGFAWMQANASKYGLINFSEESWHWSVNGH